ncbi:cyclin-like protein [Cryomyces antarcticus]
MAPATPRGSAGSTENGSIGPHPSFIRVANPYIFEQQLQEAMAVNGVNEAKEDNVRLQGVTWIDSVRKALQLPVRTYNTACVYYHKFRLVQGDSDYNYIDAAAAALFTACKIEDTLKKSREILCAAYNLKFATPAEHLSPDDPIFEGPSKTIIGLERLMLEDSGFDFRNRYPQRLLVKLAKHLDLDKDTVGKTAYSMSLDLYRTFAPLKQTTATMAISCVELAARLCDPDLTTFPTGGGIDYKKWCTSREEIMETLLDLLDLYTHHRVSTVVGNEWPLDTFIAIRIRLNQEASSKNYPRYTNWTNKKAATNGVKASNGTKASPKSPLLERKATHSPYSPSTNGAGGRVIERARDGTMRFMLDGERARDEKDIVAEYFKEEYEEYEVEVERGSRYDR